MSEAGNSNRIAREYLDSLCIETRYLSYNPVAPDTTFELYGEKFSTPIMTAALSHLDHFMFPGAAKALAEGAKAANAVLWYGMAEESEIEALADTGARMIEIIKPYADRELIYRKIAHAEKLGLLAVGIDIDHAFGPDGSFDVCDGFNMAPPSWKEMEELRRATKLPLIIKGVLSRSDAFACKQLHANGIVLSHHNNRIEYAVPPLYILKTLYEEEFLQPDMPVFVDCEIQTGMDAFKAMALGASGVCIGRPLMTTIRKNGAEGVRDYLVNATKELAKAMAFTGRGILQDIGGYPLHRM